jgi:hypothetical protein
MTSPGGASILFVVENTLDSNTKETHDARHDHEHEDDEDRRRDARRDLHKLLLDALAERKVKPAVGWSPTKSYAALIVDTKTIAYIGKQTRNGVRVEPAATSAQLPASLRKTITERKTKSTRFVTVGTVSAPKQLPAIADALAAVMQHDADAAAAKRSTSATKAK